MWVGCGRVAGFGSVVLVGKGAVVRNTNFADHVLFVQRGLIAEIGVPESGGLA